MPKITYNASQGLVQEAGSGIVFESLPTATVSAKTAAATIATPGVYTVTAGAAVGMTMPLASSVPGGLFVFRNGDAQANFLTGSAETSGTKVFAGMPGTGAQSAQGSKLTLTAEIGSSVSVLSDGKNFMVLGASGSYSISGT